MKIRKYKTADYEFVRDICYETGYFGESVDKSGLFKDRNLFCLLFCDYYLLYEAEWVFIAVDEDKQEIPIGYMIGSPDSSRQSKAFVRYMAPKLIKQVLEKTLWRYPESVVAVLMFMLSIHKFRPINGLYKNYPAHFHINVKQEYQGRHVGKALYQTFEYAMRQSGIGGIHLHTTDRNKKAIIFYERLGYKVLQSGVGGAWPKSGKYRDLLMGKKLSYPILPE